MNWLFNPCLPCCTAASCIISVTGRVVDGDSHAPLTPVNPRLDVFSLAQNKWVLVGFFPGTLDANKKFTLRFAMANGFRSYADSTRRFKFRVVSTLPCPYLPVSPKVFDASCGDTLDVGDLSAYKMTAPNLALDFTYLASVDHVIQPKTFTYAMGLTTSGFGAGTWTVNGQYAPIEPIEPPGIPILQFRFIQAGTPVPAGWEFVFDAPVPHITIPIFDYNCVLTGSYFPGPPCTSDDSHTFAFACGTSGFALSHTMGPGLTVDRDGNIVSGVSGDTCSGRIINYAATGAGSSSAPDAADNFTARPFRMTVDLTSQVGRYSGRACDGTDPLTTTDMKLVLREV